MTLDTVGHLIWNFLPAVGVLFFMAPALEAQTRMAVWSGIVGCTAMAVWALLYMHLGDPFSVWPLWLAVTGANVAVLAGLARLLLNPALRAQRGL